MTLRCLLLCTAGLLVAAHGMARAEQADAAVERDRIAAERSAAQALFAQRERDCQQRFAVTACVNDARAQQRETLGQLRRQQGLLDEAQRRQRAAERMAAIREKVSSEEERARQPPAPRRDPLMRAGAPRAGVPRAAAAPASAASEVRAADEARSQVRFEARQRDAQAHREAAEKRSAERAASGKKPVAPLPPASAPG